MTERICERCGEHWGASKADDQQSDFCDRCGQAVPELTEERSRQFIGWFAVVSLFCCAMFFILPR